jgi:DUF177 domain-containing protein
MSARLPEQIDAIRLADESVRLRGELSASGLQRLRELSPSGAHLEPVVVDLEFERTIHGVRLMHGTIRTTVEAVCQRCLQPVALAVTARPFVVLQVAGEESVSGPEEAETLVVEGPLSLAELAEDELLLAMPMIPMHEEGACAAPRDQGEAPSKAVEIPNPFSVLRGLKGKD